MHLAIRLCAWSLKLSKPVIKYANQVIFVITARVVLKMWRWGSRCSFLVFNYKNRCLARMNIYPEKTVDEKGRHRFLSTTFKEFYDNTNIPKIRRTFMEDIPGVICDTFIIKNCFNF